MVRWFVSTGSSVLLRSAVCLAICVGSATTALAQVPPATTPDTAVSSARSYTFEWLIVVVMMGLAIYELCRPGNRHQN